MEAIVRRLWRSRAGAFGPICFVLGLGFSVVLTLLPGRLVIGVTLIGLVTGPGYWTAE